MAQYFSDVVLSAKGVTKGYCNGGVETKILDNLSLDICSGEIVLLIGNSGSGKTTLLQILGLIDQAESGSIKISGRECANLGSMDRSMLLRKEISFIYQFHHLFTEFSVLDNVIIPQLIAGVSRSDAIAVAISALKELDLGHRLHHMPYMLSGGEKQRVAIARAVVKLPKLIFADEPTGNLDPSLSHRVFALMRKQVKERDIAMLCVTHNHEFLQYADRCYEIKDGRCIERDMQGL